MKIKPQRKDIRKNVETWADKWLYTLLRFSIYYAINDYVLVKSCIYSILVKVFIYLYMCVNIVLFLRSRKSEKVYRSIVTAGYSKRLFPVFLLWRFCRILRWKCYLFIWLEYIIWSDISICLAIIRTYYHYHSFPPWAACLPASQPQHIIPTSHFIGCSRKFQMKSINKCIIFRLNTFLFRTLFHILSLSMFYLSLFLCSIFLTLAHHCLPLIFALALFSRVYSAVSAVYSCIFFTDIIYGF